MAGDATATPDTDATAVGFGPGDGARVRDAIAAARHLGRYRIDGMLGSGGMGLVLSGFDPELDRAVAIKVLRHADDELQARLLREAQAMARLRHANVVAVHDVGEVDGRVFVAMELVEGTTLRAWLAQARPWRAVIATFVAAARGLAAAHAAGVVHRDFKPDNVLVGADGVVRVADFGLARASPGEAASSPVGGDELTGAGQVMGTPAYMAPEQHDGETAGPAADQFAFGAALWEALCGARPFLGGTPDAMALAKRAGRLEAPARRPPGWTLAILRRTLAPRPEARYPAMTDVIAALERGLRRRRDGIVAASAIAAVAATATLTFAATAGAPATGPSCPRARDAVAAVWNADARGQVAAAFAASGRPHAPATRDRVLAALDEHAARLGGARVAACEATHVRGEQSPEALDRRVACLDRRTATLGALVGVLGGRLDDVAVDAAYEAVLALPDPDGCAAAAASTVEPPAPAIAAAVAAARDQAARAHALLSAGQLDAAAAAAEPLVVSARQLAYPPLLAEVLALAAEVRSNQGDPEAALRAYQDAASAAAAAADDRRIAEAWIRQLVVLADEAGKPAVALERLALAEVAVTRAAAPELREELLVARSDIFLALARYDEARVDIEAARAAVEARLGPTSFATGRVLSRHADVLWHLGQNATALALDRATLAIWTETLGPDHPKVAQLLNNLGLRLEAAGEFAEADRRLRRSLEIKEATFGADHPSVAITLNNLSMVADSQGRQADAGRFAERALAIRERALGPEHPLVASSLSNLAIHRRLDGRLDEALALHRRALAIREKVNGPEHPSVAVTANALANVLLDLDRRDEALAAVQRALAIRERALGPSHELVGKSLVTLGAVRAAQGRRAEACAAWARGVELLERALGPSHPDLTGPLGDHARCVLAAGRAADALALAERAVAAGQAAGKEPLVVARAQVALAHALWASGVAADRDRARALAGAARDLLATGPPTAQREAAAVTAWLRARPPRATGAAR
ncbi:MAG: serine/threonine-protein kinase [Myxococcales bacterium]|nr:serine/threonine-protein kinase [Myxococcales bacterium]